MRERAEKEWSGRLEGRERGRNGRRGGEEVARPPRANKEREKRVIVTEHALCV